MKAEELRLGVLIYKLGDIIQADIQDIQSIKDAESLGIDHMYSPIPITEEWLERFGFEKQDNEPTERWMTEEGFEIDVMGDKVAHPIYDFESCPSSTHYIGHCEYVHQLQNLFFIIEAEELTLTRT